MQRQIFLINEKKKKRMIFRSKHTLREKLLQLVDLQISIIC